MLHPRFFRLPRTSFFLFGPRGTGKSTWLQQVLPDALFVDLLQPEPYRLLDLRGLSAFRSDYPEATGMFLYRGRERLRIDGVWCLPVTELLQEMWPGRALFEPPSPTIDD